MIPKQKKERSFNDPGEIKKSYFDLGWFVVVMVFEIVVITSDQIINQTRIDLISLVFFITIPAIISSLIISVIAKYCYGNLSSGGDKI